MKFATRTLYAPRILLDIARHHGQGPVPSSQTSLRQGISVKYLDQIIRPLKKARLVSSVRGPKGGQVLVKEPSEITMGQILRVMEGNLQLNDQQGIPDSGALRDDTRLRQVWQEATRALFDKLDSITLADLLTGPDPGETETGSKPAQRGAGRGRTGPVRANKAGKPKTI